jgi:hypothetical protein
MSIANRPQLSKLPRIAASRKGEQSAWDLANWWRQADYQSAAG